MADYARDLPDLPPRLDQAILDPLMTDIQLFELCDFGRQEGVRGICTTPLQVPIVRERLGGSEDGGPRLIAAIGFPFGSIPAELKLAEAEWAASHGAQELDAVPDFHALVNGDSGAFAEELAALCDLGLPLRVILDMARLSDELLTLAVEASIDAGAAALQTGNGFGPACNPDQVKQLRALCRNRCGIKAAGGVHNIDLMADLIEAGADLLGTSSAPQLLQSLRRPAA